MRCGGTCEGGKKRCLEHEDYTPFDRFAEFYFSRLETLY